MYKYKCSEYEKIIYDALDTLFKIDSIKQLYGDNYKATKFSFLPKNKTSFFFIKEYLETKYDIKLKTVDLNKTDAIFIKYLKKNINNILKYKHINLHNILVICRFNGKSGEKLFLNIFNIQNLQPFLCTGTIEDKIGKVDMTYIIKNKTKTAQIKTLQHIEIDKVNNIIKLIGNIDLNFEDLKKVDTLLFYDRNNETSYMLHSKNLISIENEFSEEKHLCYIDALYICSDDKKKFNRV